MLLLQGVYMENKTIYELLKEKRNEKGISQKELACRIGMTQQAIALIETGKRKIEFETFFNILSCLDLDNQEIDKVVNEAISIIFNDNYWVMRWNFENNETDFYHFDLSDKSKLFGLYNKLNNTGKDEALKRVEELTEIKKYTE